MNQIKKYSVNNEEIYGVIYKITNLINEKVYIGVSTMIDSGIENAVNKRYNNNIKNTHNEHLKNSMNKYGIENFEINPVMDVAYSQDELDELEDLYIERYDSLNPNFGYNKRGGGSRGRLSDETKNKMRNVWTDEYKENHSKKIKAKWEELEYQERMSAVLRKRWQDEEYRDYMCNMSKELWNNEAHRNRIINSIKERWQDEEFRKTQSEERKARWENNEYRGKMSKIRSGGGNSRAIKVTVKVKGEYRFFGCKKEAFTNIGVSKDVFNMSIKLGLTPKILKVGVTEIIIGDKVIDYTSRDK